MASIKSNNPLRGLKERMAARRAAEQQVSITINPLRNIAKQVSITPQTYGSFNIIKNYLSKAGTAANAMLAERDEHGNTVLMVSILNADYKTVEYLVKEKNAPVNPINNLGMTALMFACIKGRGDVIDLLLERMTPDDINVATTEHGITALMFACEEGTLENVKKLVKGGADVNIEQTSEDGGSAINIASKGEIITYLQTIRGPRGGRRTRLKKRNTSARRASPTRRRGRRRT